MKFIENIKNKRKIKKIINSNDSDKVKSVKEITEDEKIEEIILSIKDKDKRAKAVVQNIANIDDKDILKNIIPTLKDDDILKLLKYKEKYLNNEEINILYTTISGIVDLDKRMKAIEMFENSLPDHELSNLLGAIKDKKGDKYECKKIDISTDKIIENYIKYGTIMHIDYLTWHLENEHSKLKVLQKCLERSISVEKRNHILFNKEDKIVLMNKIFSSVIKNGKNSTLDRKKVKIIFDMFKSEEISYEEARQLAEKHIRNEEILKQTKDALLKQEAKKEYKDSQMKNKEQLEIKEETEIYI